MTSTHPQSVPPLAEQSAPGFAPVTTPDEGSIAQSVTGSNANGSASWISSFLSDKYVLHTS